jgi:hypothetical protein
MFIVSFFNFDKFISLIYQNCIFFKSIGFHVVLIVRFLSVYLYLGRVNRP